MEKIGKIDEQMAMTAQTLLWDKPQSQKSTLIIIKSNYFIIRIILIIN